MTTTYITTSQFNVIQQTMQHWQLQLQNWKEMHICLRGERLRKVSGNSPYKPFWYLTTYVDYESETFPKNSYGPL